MAHKNKRSGKVERRIYSGSALEFRAGEGDDAVPVLAGYAAMFGELSEDLGGFREVIAPGAFAKALGGDVRALFNHDGNLILGRTKSKTLRLEEDQRGLRVEILPPDTSAARDLMTSVQRGDVDQMSFGFRTVEDKWEVVDGENIRTLIEVRLFDVSPVTFPAYPQTEIALRSMEAWQDETKEDPVPDYSNERRKLDLIGA